MTVYNFLPYVDVTVGPILFKLFLIEIGVWMKETNKICQKKQCSLKYKSIVISHVFFISFSLYFEKENNLTPWTDILIQTYIRHLEDASRLSISLLRPASSLCSLPNFMYYIITICFLHNWYFFSSFDINEGFFVIFNWRMRRSYRKLILR